MILASIFIDPAGGGDLPALVQQNIASLIEHHPGIPHRLFGGEDIEAFLEAHFPSEVQEAYRSLIPLAYKADLARYCIIYELGGIYADLSIFFARPVPFDGKRPFVFRDLMGAAPWNTNTAMFAASERCKALELAIDLVCANVRRRYYGPTFLCPTGPTVFGKALATTCDADELTSGISFAHTREMLRKNFPDLALPKGRLFHCLVHSGKIVAIKRKRGNEGLRDLGIANSDDYVSRWKAREVYGST